MGVHEDSGVETASARVGVLGATVGVGEAARLLGIGRTLAYRLASRDELPVPVIRVGRTLRVPAAPLRALLGLGADGVAGVAGVGGGEFGSGVAGGRASS